MRGERVVGIHQPEYLPWLGFLNKLVNSNTFVLLDNVQFRKNYFQNRNRIRTSEGWVWLTVPVKKGPLERLISEIEINNSTEWGVTHWKSIQQNYSRLRFFEDYSGFFEDVFNTVWNHLSELNTEIIRYFADSLGIETEIISASNMETSGSSSELLLNICNKLDADIYLSGSFGKNYLNETLFREAGIEVVYQDFHHPEYRQVYEPFVSDMSGLDLLFNEGASGQEIIKKGWKLEN